ncbi:MAG: PIN domain-containing protein [Pseudohongiella sp.]|nr:PIN domain-containing protein [Pseudohongiella sp.]
MYMLDTDTCIYVLKSRDTSLRHKFKTARHLAISSIVYGELCFGIENGDPEMRSRRYEQLKRFLRKINIEPWTANEGVLYGQLRSRLKRAGMIIGNNDLLIAAHALSCEATLVTNNQREFSRIAGLVCDNWLENP